MTFEYILGGMLQRVRAANPNLDTREGSIIYSALAPDAVSLTNAYIELDTVLNESFADTASRYYLTLRAKERGIEPFPATYAVLQGEFKDTFGALRTIAQGARFSLGAQIPKVGVVSG